MTKRIVVVGGTSGIGLELAKAVVANGDTVVINTAQAEPKDGAVFAVNYEGQLVIKRLVRDAGQWWLEGQLAPGSQPAQVQQRSGAAQNRSLDCARLR